MEDVYKRQMHSMIPIICAAIFAGYYHISRWELATKVSALSRIHIWNWVGHRECHILPDWLLIYRLEAEVLVLTLARTGTHSDLFGK